MKLIEEELPPTLLDEKLFSLLGRLHVLLRRETGRVTDIKYMAVDSDYAQYVLSLCEETYSEDLSKVKISVKNYLFGNGGRFTNKINKMNSLSASHTENIKHTIPNENLIQHSSSQQYYIGRLR